MTTKQSKKAGLLNRKIAGNEEILKSLRKTDHAIEEQKCLSTRVMLTYQAKGEIAREIVIDPEWFNSAELKSDFQHCAKIAKDGFMELLEKDLQLMKEASGIVTPNEKK